jgi:hypothetical protein
VAWQAGIPRRENSGAANEGRDPLKFTSKTELLPEAEDLL